MRSSHGLQRAARMPITSAIVGSLVVALSLTSMPVARTAAHSHAHEHHLHLSSPAASLFPSSAESDATGQQGSGDRAVAHLANGQPVHSRRIRAAAPDARLFVIGHGAAEPTMGIDENGWLYYTAAFPAPDVMRSKDEGATWEIASPQIGGQRTHRLTLDPYLYVDPDTSRVFTVDLIPCPQISFTDDGGESWRTITQPCQETDHQTLFSGPPVLSPTAGYPNIVYYCAISGGALAGTSTMTACSKSLDGGMSFVPTGEPAFTDDPRHEQSQMGIPGHCAGATGHGFVDREGTVYLPRGWCENPWLAISHDEGATWTRVQVASNGMDTDDGIFAHEAGVAVDAKGNIYYDWVGADRLPYLAISRDGGETWSRPIMVGPPGLEAASLPGIAVGAPGKIAMVYMGTNTLDRAIDGWDKVGWNGYITMTTDALGKNPVFYSGSVNDPSDPLVAGVCGGLRCSAEYDFIDVVIDAAGTPWAALVDGCTPAACAVSTPSDPLPAGIDFQGIVGRLIGGPPLI